jgi:hypothetical protein
VLGSEFWYCLATLALYALAFPFCKVSVLKRASEFVPSPTFCALTYCNNHHDHKTAATLIKYTHTLTVLDASYSPFQPVLRALFTIPISSMKTVRLHEFRLTSRRSHRDKVV